MWACTFQSDDLFSSSGQCKWLQLDRRVLEHDFSKKSGPIALLFLVRYVISASWCLKSHDHSDHRMQHIPGLNHCTAAALKKHLVLDLKWGFLSFGYDSPRLTLQNCEMSFAGSILRAFHFWRSTRLWSYSFWMPRRPSIMWVHLCLFTHRSTWRSRFSPL